MSSNDAEAGLEYSLASLRELIFSALEIAGARWVVEVGSATGSFTRELLRWSEASGARITAVDSAPPPPLRELASSEPSLELIEAKSLDALPTLDSVDAYVIDGDHNYFTVSEELRLIGARGHRDWGFPLVLLHDVCWPWGRRDCYYSRDDIGEADRQPSMPGEEFGDWGRAALSGSGIHVATTEGGPRNGVLTAVEDHVAGRPDLRLAVISAFHGLAVIFPVGPDWSSRLAAVLEPWDRHPVLTRLEGDRVEKVRNTAALTLQLHQNAKDAERHARELEQGWKESVDHVAELERQLVEQSENASKLARGWKEAAQRFDTVQRTMYMYEQALFRQELDWRASVSGPEVVAEVVPGGPDDRDYDRWMAARPTPPAPATGPKFSILTPVFDPDSRYLESCIRSVRAQSYPHWQLVLANVSTSPHVGPICRRFTLLDERLTVVGGANEGIAHNTDLAAGHADGDWLVFLDHDDELAPHALAALASVVEGDTEVDFIYSDEDKLDLSGRRVDPFFKPDWSPDLLRMVNYIGHLVAVRRSLFDEVGGMRPGFDGAQDFDFLLRATCRARRVVHIPDVLYHWRRHEMSTANDVRNKPEAHGAGRRALQEFADEWAAGAWVDLGSGPTTHRLRYPLRAEQVSIIIPFRDGAELTDACLQSVSRHFNELPFEVLLVSNQSGEEKTFALMEAWERQYQWARCLEYDRPFNFQALNNWAVERAEGSLLLFLNNDTEVLHDGWLDGLAEHAQRPEVGAVGPRLFYPNGLVQHAGVAVGIGGFAEHPWAGLHPDAWTVAGPSYWVRNFLSVTAACMMVGRAKYEQVGGFEERFQVCGGDVDLGIRLRQAGYWNVMTPFIRVVHHEAMTRDRRPPGEDVEQSLRSYEPYLGGRDPFYNPNLTLVDTTCGLAVP